MNHQIIKLAYKLCSIPSVSGNEADVLQYLSLWFSEQGLIVEKHLVDNNRYNIFAYRTKKAAYSAIFCTHIDTVAPFIKPRLDDEEGVLWGRGSCDAKGIAAAMIYAALADYGDGFDDTALLLTVGEEEASDGAKASAPKLLSRAQFVVVGEPTELRAAFAQKGSLVFDLEACGKEAHSSQPELGDSAIHKLVHDMERIMSCDWPHDPHYGKTMVNFGQIAGGSMRNVLAKEAFAKGIMRTSVNNDALLDQMRSMLSPGVNCSVLSSENPFSFFAPRGFAQFLAAFGSDAPYLRGVGKPMLIGPGSLRYAHRPDEHIAYADLDAGMHAYRRIAQEVREALLDNKNNVA